MEPANSVAATKTPIIFLGVGEHLTDLDRFSPEPFISKMLGMGDVQGLVEHMQSVAMQNPERQKEMVKKFEELGAAGDLGDEAVKKRKIYPGRPYHV